MKTTVTDRSIALAFVWGCDYVNEPSIQEPEIRRWLATGEELGIVKSELQRTAELISILTQTQGASRISALTQLLTEKRGLSG